MPYITKKYWVTESLESYYRYKKEKYINVLDNFGHLFFIILPLGIISGLVLLILHIKLEIIYRYKKFRGITEITYKYKEHIDIGTMGGSLD